MLEIVILAVIGTALAGIWDLKTTEVPDQLPYAMVGVGILYWLARFLMGGGAYTLLVSLLVGTLLLAVGLLLYKKRQWGGADAWILAAIGYMIPVYGGSLFIIPYLMNFMVVSIVYTVAYALAVGLLNRRVFPYVAKDLRQHAKIIAASTVGVAAVVAALGAPAFLLSRLVPLIFLLLVFWRYAVVIERRVFRKKIPVSELKSGDVMEGGKWVGLTEQDVRRIKRSRRFVVIKDGMRFVPVFAIALVLTLLYGNLFFIVFG